MLSMISIPIIIVCDSDYLHLINSDKWKLENRDHETAFNSKSLDYKLSETEFMMLLIFTLLIERNKNFEDELKNSILY